MSTTRDQLSGWHPEDIKAAVRRRGSTLTQLSRDHGFCDAAASQALRRTWRAVEKVIADFLGVPARRLWPERYQPRRARRRGGRRG